MNTEAFLERLEGVRRSGAGHVARCPAHDDRQASLSVKESDDGTILLNCFAGCSARDVCGALGIRMSDLFPPQEEVTYVYRDELGRPLYDKIRKPDKQFYYRRYVGDSTEDGLGDTGKALYHLDELVQADSEQIIWITEGEKDADAIRREGGLATTQGGANDWRDEFAEFFRGRYVRVCQDNDPPGRKTACQIMLSLKGVAKEVRLREAALGKDAYDHLAAGYGLEDFIEPSLFPKLDWSKPYEAPPSVWESFVHVGDLVLEAGAPKLGKSWLTMALSTVMANGGGYLLDHSVIPGRVLYFDEENPEDVIKRRFLALGLSSFDNVMVIPGGGLRLDAHPELLMQQALMFQPDLIVIDSLARVHTKDENSFAEMSEILNNVLKPLARESGAAVILIHHEARAGNVRGSTDIEAAVDTILNVRGTPGEGVFTVSMKGRRRSSGGEYTQVAIRDMPGIGTRLEVVA